MIDLRAIDFHYPGQPPIFEGFEWRVQPGESWAVIGPSGCGKTTLLYLLAGLRHPDRGAILIAGEPLSKPRPRTGLILQDFGLLPWATVRQNASLGLRLRGFYGPDGLHAPHEEVVGNILELTDYWLARLGLDEVQAQYPSQISGGQRQRTAIARTLVLNPDLLLMDEPFASLDAPTRESLQALMISLREEQNLTTVIVTHAIEEAALLGEKILVLSQPPNRAAQVVLNPQAGHAGFSQSTAFLEICAQLRAMLETNE